MHNKHAYVHRDEPIKVFLSLAPVTVDPNYPRAIITDTWIFLTVEPIESSTNCIVQL